MKNVQAQFQMLDSYVKEYTLKTNCKLSEHMNINSYDNIHTPEHVNENSYVNNVNKNYYYPNNNLKKIKLKYYIKNMSKNIFAFFGTILIMGLFLFILWQIPFVKNYLKNLYNDNFILQYFISIFKNLFS